MRKVPSWKKTIGNVAYLFSIKRVYCEWFVYNQCFHHCKCVTVLEYYTHGYFTLMYSFLFHLTYISKHNNLSSGKSLFSFFQTNHSTSGREKKTCDSIWHCYQSTAFRARIGESDWVVSRLIWRASVDKTSYLLHTVWSQNWRAVFVLQEYYPTSPWRKRMDTTRIFWLLKGSLGPSSTKLRLMTSHSGLYRWI